MAGPRVLLYSDARVHGGAERYLLELTRELPHEGFRVELATSEEGALDAFAAEVQRLGLPLRRLPRIETLADRGALLKVWRFFATNHPHILHFNLVDPRACHGAMVAALCALRRGFVVTEHLARNRFDGGPLPFRVRLASRSIRATIVLNEADQSAVENRPLNRSRVVVVPNGITDPGPGTPERRERARATLGFPGHAGPILGFVGRMIPQKNPDLFLEGARRLAPARPDARFVLLGDGPELPALQAKVQQLGLGPVTRFLGHRHDAPELVFGLDLLANTSRAEGQPISVLEAMASEVCVVAPAIPGLTSLVADGASGFLVPPEDGDALGRILHEALSDPARLACMGRVGRERYLALHTARAMAARTARIYRELL
jgi:glycosyltransferase involved in cell wall biosynthesis